jgi:hypothetical protein
MVEWSMNARAARHKEAGVAALVSHPTALQPAGDRGEQDV